MNIFLDTAHTQEWGNIPGCAPIQGVTTNPTLVIQAGMRVTLASYKTFIDMAQQKAIPELMLQLPSPLPNDALVWAEQLSQHASRVTLTFKLPCHPEWQAAHTALRSAGFATLLTGVSNSVQLLWARSQDATYVAPYLSRLATAGRDVEGFISAAIAVQRSGGPKLMAASVKTEGLFALLLAQGAAACTVKPAFLNQLSHDDVTDQAVAQFSKDCALSEDRPN